VCGRPASFWDACDFSAHCERRGAPDLLPPAGVTVPYHRCANCGFVFTPFMDDFTPDEFKSRVYNDDYCKVDPDFDSVRPREFAERLLGHLGDCAIRVCDYGGGRGLMARAINDAGRALSAVSWDPHYDADAAPAGPFHLVTSFEVFEHTPTPRATFDEMLALTDENRVILMSTLCQPDDIERQKTGWWYCSPRNGHISLHTLESLAWLADDAGLEVIHFDEGTHLFYGCVPEWLAPRLEGYAGRLPK
jgi:2-polyprenyl-6-hydroxyphenyl methylase/3-demethylubiquinone-9 3-methyltransferase